MSENDEWALYQVIYFNKRHGQREVKEVFARSRNEAIVTCWNMLLFSPEVEILVDDDHKIETRLVSYIDAIKKPLPKV